MKTYYAVLGLYLCTITGAMALPTTQTGRTNSVRAGSPAAKAIIQTLPRKGNNAVLPTTARSATLDKKKTITTTSESDTARMPISGKGVYSKNSPAINTQTAATSNSVKELQAKIDTLTAQLATVQTELDTKAATSDVTAVADAVANVDVSGQITEALTDYAKSNDLTTLQNTVSNKANKDEFNTVKEKVTTLENNMDSKANKDEFNTVKEKVTTLETNIDSKASKEEFDTVKNAINNEETGLAALNTKISNIGTSEATVSPEMANELSALKETVTNNETGLVKKVATLENNMGNKANSDDVYNKSTIDEKMNGKADKDEFNFVKNAVNNEETGLAALNDKVNNKANASDTYTKLEVDNAILNAQFTPGEEVNADAFAALVQRVSTLEQAGYLTAESDALKSFITNDQAEAKIASAKSEIEGKGYLTSESDALKSFITNDQADAKIASAKSDAEAKYVTNTGLATMGFLTAESEKIATIEYNIAQKPSENDVKGWVSTAKEEAISAADLSAGSKYVTNTGLATMGFQTASQVGSAIANADLSTKMGNYLNNNGYKTASATIADAKADSAFVKTTDANYTTLTGLVSIASDLSDLAQQKAALITLAGTANVDDPEEDQELQGDPGTSGGTGTGTTPGGGGTSAGING